MKNFEEEETKNIIYEEAFANLVNIKTEFEQQAIIKLIPTLNNGLPSMRKYIALPFKESFTAPTTQRGGLYSALLYNYPQSISFIDFRPVVRIIEDEFNESFSFAQYYTTPSNYYYFGWQALTERKGALLEAFNKAVTELNLLYEQNSEQLSMASIEGSFKASLKKLEDPFYYKESEWLVKPSFKL